MDKNVYILNETSLGNNTGVNSYIKQLAIYLTNKTNLNVYIIDICLEQKEFIIESKNSISIYHIPIQWEMLIKKKKRYYRNIFYLLEPYLKNTSDSIFLVNLFIHDEVIRLLKEKYYNINIFFVVHYLDLNYLAKWDTNILNDLSSLEDTIVDKFNIHQLIERDRFIFNHVDKIICLSEETKKLLQTYYQLTENRISIVYNGLKDEAIFISKMEKQLLKMRLSFNKDDRIILYVGRLDPYKGIFELIQAFKQIVNKTPNTRLVLVGGGDISLFLKECQGFWSKITFTGLIDKEYVYKFYQIATIGVLPSYTEQCSYAAIEMMMHGLPLIGTTTGGISEMIEEGKTGYKIHLKEEDNKKILNINELAIKIEELLYDEIKRSFFSRYSRMRYEKYYQLNIMGNEMEKIIYGK